jgi:plastocyanin
MKCGMTIAASVVAGVLAGCATRTPENPGNLGQRLDPASFYLPNAGASKILSVTTDTNAPARAAVLIQTHAVVIKETGPAETIAKFGEVYAFSPAFIAVHRDEPTLMRFWNLQADDNHDFMIIDPHGKVLMSQLLPPLKETDYVFTFHEEGLFRMICAMHQPSMNAQILVLPALLSAP